MTVNSSFFPSDHISIFLAKNRRERIPMSQGSGYYDFQLSEAGIVKVDFDNKEKELIVTPLRIGHVRQNKKKTPEYYFLLMSFLIGIFRLVSN